MRFWFVLALALVGCKNDSAPTPAPTPPPVASAGIDLYVDDQVIAHVTLAQLRTWPRIDSLVPVPARRLGTWDDIATRGQKTSQVTDLRRPSDKYPQLVPALFVAESGKPAFGMFDPVELAKHGKPELHEDDITEVRIALQKGGGRGEHDSSEGGGSDPMKLELSVKTPKGQSKLTGDKLLAIPREPMPGETEPHGWSLTTVLHAAGIDKFEKLVLTDQAGLSLNLDKTDFDPNASVPFVKLNRQGALRMLVFKKQGTAWQKSGDLRGLVSIEQLK